MERFTILSFYFSSSHSMPVLQVSSGGASMLMDSTRMEREVAKLKQRAAAEEDLFARVPLKREERLKVKALRRQARTTR